MLTAQCPLPLFSPWLLQVNLMQYMKLSTSRDFRINASMLDSVLQEQNTENAENEPDNDQVRTHLAAFADTFPPLLRPAVFVSCAGVCEMRTVCLPRVSSHFNTKLIGRREGLVWLTSPTLQPSALSDLYFHAPIIWISGLREARLLLRPCCLPQQAERSISTTSEDLLAGQDQTFAA